MSDDPGATHYVGDGCDPPHVVPTICPHGHDVTYTPCTWCTHADTPAFICPRCGARSWHPDDAGHGYCGRCHAFTRDEGTDWRAFAGDMLSDDPERIRRHLPDWMRALVDDGPTDDE